MNFLAILSEIKFNDIRIFFEISKYALSTHTVRAVGFGEDGDAVGVDGVLHVGRRRARRRCRFHHGEEDEDRNGDSN